MEIFLIKSGYHNQHHVENLASIFFIWLHDASKKTLVASTKPLGNLKPNRSGNSRELL
jgi:hypothetical protein